MSALVQLRPAEATLTKRQLAAHLGRSERWVELRVAEGMPSLSPTARFASRRFVLSEVERWLGEGRPSVRPVPERLAELERQVVGLLARIEELEER